MLLLYFYRMLLSSLLVLRPFGYYRIDQDRDSDANKTWNGHFSVGRLSVRHWLIRRCIANFFCVRVCVCVFFLFQFYCFTLDRRFSYQSAASLCFYSAQSFTCRRRFFSILIFRIHTADRSKVCMIFAFGTILL